MNPSAQLAIIIPAYKTKFLRAALDSVAVQTDKNFQLYVFDDCSPEPVGDVVREYSGRLPSLKFHRFSENLGGTSLVRHWERCIRMTGEPWIWMFADDDVMEAGCVADFYAELRSTGAAHDLYRFNTVWINGAGVKTRDCPKHPSSESGAEYLLARLDGKRNASMQEIIFLRSAWEACGIPDFPLAWHSDEAFIASLGARKPLRAVPGAHLNWRYSATNISGSASFQLTNRKIMASTEFFRWAAIFLGTHAPAQKDPAVRASEAWLLNYLRTCWEFVGLKTCFALDKLAREVWHRPPGWGFFTGVWMNFSLILKKITGRLGLKTRAGST